MNGDAYSSRDHVSRKTINASTTNANTHVQRRDDRRDDRREDRRDDRRDDRRERRRSRSPGHRSSRQDYEVDSYSSQRDHRAREREDRYRDRRDDRDWNRDRGDRGDRRDTRRDRDDRPPRRDRGDRDLFDDRRGGGGRRDDRGGGGRGERKKSATPPPKPREPTPDLTDVVSILERKRRLTQWDIKPPGYDNVTAEQAKLSGMFSLPGAPRQQPMDPSRLQAFMNQPAGQANNSALRAANAKQSRRLFVHNLPASSTDASVIEFFNLQMNGVNVVSGADPCISVMLSQDNTFALVEFRTSEDATYALALDGISLEADAANGAANGASTGLSIRRPKDYIVPSAGEEAQDEPMGTISSVVKDGPNKISVTKIPAYLTDEQITELLASFGELKAFVLAKDTGTEQSKGIAFCEYTDPTNTEVAVEGLNGMELGDSQLRVTRASIGAVQASGLEMSVNAMSALAGSTSADLEQGRVLQLLNMVTAEELMDAEEYKEILDDVKEECENYGTVLDIKIPRPSGGARQQSGVGKIFVKWESEESAQKAMKALAGRKFADRTVVVTFFGEEYFDVGAW